MKWSCKKSFLFSGILVVGILALLVMIWLPSYRKNRDLGRFYGEFGFSLPVDTNVLFKKIQFGAMGDGSSLVIYQLSPDKMKKFTKISILKTWSELPINKEVYTELVGKISNSDEEVTRHLSLGWQDGFYYIKDRFLSYDPESKAKYGDESYRFQNFTLGIIDMKDNKIYLYRYNQ